MKAWCFIFTLFISTVGLFREMPFLLVARSSGPLGDPYVNITDNAVVSVTAGTKFGVVELGGENKRKL